MTVPAQVVHAVGVTGRGLVRAANQDALMMFEWQSQSRRSQLVDLRGVWAPPVVCAVADGLGGHQAGELASRIALDEVCARYDAWTTPAELAAGLIATNERLYATAQRSPDTVGMGTTIAGMVLLASVSLCFNVGDSRIYRVTDGYLEQISIDDNASAGSSRVSQALGGAPGDPLQPHVTSVPLTGGGRFILCSDGAYVPVDDAVFRRLCRQSDLDLLVRGLREAAYEAGAPDNVSLVAVDVPAAIRAEDGAEDVKVIPSA